MGTLTGIVSQRRAWHNHQMTTMGLLLDAGSGSRFAGEAHKLRAMLRGGTVLSHALSTFRAVDFDEHVIVWGAEDLADLVEPGWALLLENRDHLDGQATSLSVGIDHAVISGHDAVIVGLADQPFVDIDAWRSVRDASGLLVTASYGGQRSPPVKIDQTLFEELPRTGDVGAKALMTSRPELVTEVTCGSNPADIDTHEDLDQWN